MTGGQEMICFTIIVEHLGADGAKAIFKFRKLEVELKTNVSGCAWC